jgi:hypothetical protein
MKFWVPILLLLIGIGIAIAWRTRERFAVGSIPPTWEEGLTMIEGACRGDSVDTVNGECPQGTFMNEENMCQRIVPPMCPVGYDLQINDELGTSMCVPFEQPPADKPADKPAAGEDMLDLTCSDGSKAIGEKCFDPADTGTPPNVCSGSAQLENGMCVTLLEGGTTVGSESPECPSGTMLKADNKCVAYTIQQCPSGYTKQIIPPGRVKCVRTKQGGTAGGTASGTADEPADEPADEGVTPATVRKNNVLGPVFTSYGAPVEESSPDSSKGNQYPELLGGGDPASRQREGGGSGGGEFGIGIGDLTGSMPTAGGLGSTEESRFFPTSRQPGDMDLIPDPYRVSQQFSTSSYSFKTEPTPFLTDFSAFSR